MSFLYLLRISKISHTCFISGFAPISQSAHDTYQPTLQTSENFPGKHHTRVLFHSSNGYPKSQTSQVSFGLSSYKTPSLQTQSYRAPVVQTPSLQAQPINVPSSQESYSSVEVGTPQYSYLPSKAEVNQDYAYDYSTQAAAKANANQAYSYDYATQPLSQVYYQPQEQQVQVYDNQHQPQSYEDQQSYGDRLQQHEQQQQYGSGEDYQQSGEVVSQAAAQKEETPQDYHSDSSGVVGKAKRSKRKGVVTKLQEVESTPLSVTEIDLSESEDKSKSEQST